MDEDTEPEPPKTGRIHFKLWDDHTEFPIVEESFPNIDLLEKHQYTQYQKQVLDYLGYQGDINMLQPSDTQEIQRNAALCTWVLKQGAENKEFQSVQAMMLKKEAPLSPITTVMAIHERIKEGLLK